MVFLSAAVSVFGVSFFSVKGFVFLTFSVVGVRVKLTGGRLSGVEH